MICEIIPATRTNPDKDTFSYLVPDDIKTDIKIGLIVHIPFGKKKIRGIINKIQETKDEEQTNYKLKSIISINSDFVLPKQYIDIAKWIAQYYLCSLGEAISLFLPPRLTRMRKQDTRYKIQDTNKIQLTSDQKNVLAQLTQKLKTKNYRPSLLHGVTGSGKTEIYIKLTEKVLHRNKQVIVLTPEIMLTPQIVEKFEGAFPNQICLMHSGLSASERFNSYKQFFSHEKNIIIGPRSALLVPSNNLGLIIIDEEQEDAYKQEKSPRYHAVDLAEKIAIANNAMLLLGSATPRIETYYKYHSDTTLCHSRGNGNPELDPGSPAAVRDDIKMVEEDNAFDLFELKNRYQKMILPPAQIVDLKNEIKHDNLSPISIKLQENIKKTLQEKKQIILFLNRRGMATFVSCRECGEVVLCPRCSIPMVYHVYNRQNILHCHHCDEKTPVPIICPKCHSPKIKYFGAGVDKIEKEIEKLFPKARIKKVDSRSMQNKNDYMILYDDIKNHRIDILIGTQILAKGLDIPAVDLVGVISADTGLHLPYFKASEKVFSLITQVSGRSGRKNNVGQTIIQSYWPDSFAIQAAASHDYQSYYENEITERVRHRYPPFCRLVRVIAEDKRESTAKEEICKIAHQLKSANIDFIGPAPAFLSKINNRYRYHLIIKVKKLPNNKIFEIFKSNPYLVWDPDPVDLL